MMASLCSLCLHNGLWFLYFLPPPPPPLPPLVFSDGWLLIMCMSGKNLSKLVWSRISISCNLETIVDATEQALFIPLKNMEVQCY